MHLLVRPLSWHSVPTGIRGATLALCLAAAAAAEPTPPPAAPQTRSATEPLTPRKTREEMFRDWDINADGRIDAGEAELASSRMRQQRSKMRLDGLIDPVTGRLRDEPAADTKSVDAARADADPDPDEVPPASPEKPGQPTTPAPAATLDRSAARAPVQRPMPNSGGVRAGGQAARPGYGASSSPSLNAGRPLASAPPADTPRPLNAAASAQRPVSGPGSPRSDAGAATPRPRGGLLPRPPLQPPPRSRDLYDPY